MNEARREPRTKQVGQYSLTWKGYDGNAHAAEGRGIDISPTGLGIQCPTECPVGCEAHVQAKDGSIRGDCEVIHCSAHGSGYRIGLEFRSRHTCADEPAQAGSQPDYYEILQINRNADAETIHRVFRIMAARFHPDNGETGDLETFLRVKTAYSVLSNAARRAEYDAALKQDGNAGPKTIFASKDFVVGVDAEFNRRLGVLSLLYHQRRADPDHPGVSLLDIERQMGFPRECVAFSVWHLRSKAYVVAADNSDYAITSEGADYVEKKAR